MIVFQNRRPGEEPSPLVLLVGTGLIGSKVAASLQRWGFRQVRESRLDWNHAERRDQTLAEASTDVAALAAELGSPVQIAWCAGSGSLGSTDRQLLAERGAFQAVLDLSLGLSRDHAVGFHFVSSAGALFEGQRCVTPDSVPDPRSPYGRMKLDQEQIVTANARSFALGGIVYRPSTVYGSHEFHRRAGLVSHIMWNALRNEATALEANVHALRDFVYHEDVGRFIAGNLMSPNPAGQRLAHLVTGKPSSILEVFRQVERLMGRSLTYRLRLDGVNNADITFSAQSSLRGWAPHALEVGLAAVWRETRHSFLTDHAKSAARAA